MVTNATGANSFDLYYGAGPKLRLVAGCDDSSVPTRCPIAADLTDGFPSTHGVDITGAAHADTGDLEFDPTDATPQCPYLFSSDGGIYRSDDCAPTWVRSMVGMHDTWLYDLAAWPLPGNQTGLAFGLMDSGFWSSVDGGSNWGNPSCCDIWDVMADQERVIFSFCCAKVNEGTDPPPNPVLPKTTLNVAPANDPNNAVAMTPPPTGWLMHFQEVDSMQPFADDSYVIITQTDGNSLNVLSNGPGGVWITQDVGGSYTELGQATTPANACGVEVALSGGVPTFYVITDDQSEWRPRAVQRHPGRAALEVHRYQPERRLDGGRHRIEQGGHLRRRPHQPQPPAWPGTASTSTSPTGPRSQKLTVKPLSIASLVIMRSMAKMAPSSLVAASPAASQRNTTADEMSPMVRSLAPAPIEC